LNDRQKKIVRTLQWILYPIGLVILAVMLWANSGGGSSVIAEDAARILEAAERALFVAVALVFWLVFLALATEFVLREISGAQARTRLGKALMAVRRPRLVSQLLLPGVALALVGLLNAILFDPALFGIERGGLGAAEILTFTLFYAIGHLMLVVLGLRALRDRPFFVLTDQGFLYEPGDLAPGLIPWRDVAHLKETDLLSANSSVAGAIVSRALVLTLRDPEKYMRRYNPLLQVFYRLSVKLIRTQTGGKETVAIASEDFGGRYEEVRALMARQVEKGGGRAELL